MLINYRQPLRSQPSISIGLSTSLIIFWHELSVPRYEAPVSQVAAFLSFMICWISGLMKRRTTTANQCLLLYLWIGFFELDAFCADTPAASRTFEQQLTHGGGPNLYEASTARAKMNTKMSEIVFLVVAAAMASPDEQRRLSPLQSMLSSLVRDVTVCYTFSSSIFRFPIYIGSTRSRRHIAADSSRSDVATRLEQVIYTFSIVMTSCVEK